METTGSDYIYKELGISEEVYNFGQKIEEDLRDRFAEFDRTAEYNQMKVIRAMQENRVSEACFNYVSGYGYNDLGRDTLEEVYASTFHTEAAPTVVCGALKGAVFAANVYERLGFAVVPNGSESRHDIIQAVTLGSPEGVIAFCKGIQAAAPVDSYVSPEPWAMPGYDSDVIMAAGAFVQGSSIELSADGPIKPPYAVYFQGGLTWYHAKLGILKSLQGLVDAGIVSLEQISEPGR